MDVISVVTSLVRGIAQVLHGDQVCRAQCAARSAGGGRKRMRQGRTGRSRRGESRNSRRNAHEHG